MRVEIQVLDGWMMRIVMRGKSRFHCWCKPMAADQSGQGESAFSPKIEANTTPEPRQDWQVDPLRQGNRSLGKLPLRCAAVGVRAVCCCCCGACSAAPKQTNPKTNHDDTSTTSTSCINHHRSHDPQPIPISRTEP